LKGYLKKKSLYFLQGYQQKYFVLEKRKLKYYSKEDLEQLQGCINFELVGAKLEVKAIPQYLNFRMALQKLNLRSQLLAMRESSPLRLPQQKRLKSGERP